MSEDWHRVWHWGSQREWLKGFHSGWIVLMLWACPPWSPHLAFSTSAKVQRQKYDQSNTQATHLLKHNTGSLLNFIDSWLPKCCVCTFFSFHIFSAFYTAAEVRIRVDGTVTFNLMNLHSIGRRLGMGETYDIATSLASVVNIVRNNLMVNINTDTNAIYPTISKDLSEWLNNVFVL